MNLLAAVVVSTSLTSCFDDSYDLSKDIDLTMGFGAEGLQVKLGSTEKIMLADLLETNDNLKTDDGSLYYMVESGSTEADFAVDRIRVEIERAKLSPEVEVFNYDKIMDMLGVDVPGGIKLPLKQGSEFEAKGVEAGDNLDFEFELGKDNTEDVKQIRSIKAALGTKLRAKIEIEQSPGLHFAFKKISNLNVVVPSYLKLKNATHGKIDDENYSFNDVSSSQGATVLDLGTAEVEQLYFPDNEGEIKEGILKLIGQRISMSGDFVFTTTGACEMNKGDFVNVHLYITLGEYDQEWCKIELYSITGRFNPQIVSSIEEFEVSENLPDFLRDDDVKIAVSNPTIRFDADMTNIPASFLLSAELTATKDGKVSHQISIPANKEEPIEVNKEKENTIYVYQGNSPYDPAGVVDTDGRYPVEGLTELVTNVPDIVSVDITGNKIRIKDEEITLLMNHTYDLSLDYSLFVPFIFDRDLSIVYTDSIEDLNEDLSDFEAAGIVVSGEVLNAVPLELAFTAEAFDAKGRLMSGVQVLPATIHPANPIERYADEADVERNAVRSNVEIGIKFQNPADLKKLDKIRFTVKAEGVQEDGKPAALSSLQFIKFDNVRIKLAGNVIGNFN